MIEKNVLRKEMLKKRANIAKDEREKNSRIIKNKLLSLDMYKKAERVFCYIDMGSEVITTDFIKQAWDDGKKVAVPVAKKDRFMYFVVIESFDGMTRSKLGVMEPEIGCEKQVVPCDNDIMIVPGSVFDVNKNRCGYGGGYYDTYTEKYNVKNTIGVAFDIQVVDNMPVEEFDRPLSMIITEKRDII